MAVSPYALITLDEAKEYPGMSALPASEEAMVETVIDAVTADFEDFWDNYAVQREVSEDYTYDRFVEGKIELNHYPIVSVKSITDPAGNTIASTDYWIDKAHGYLVCANTWAIPQDANGFQTYWTIVYTAGRVANTAAVPAHIKHAAKAWVAVKYRHADQDLVQKSVGDLSIRYREWQREGETEQLLPTWVRSAIVMWKKR
jgi:hypothetical protein